MSKSTKKKVVRGKRYTAEEKSKVVAFVEEYNAANGRGGQSAASAKFGTSLHVSQVYSGGCSTCSRTSLTSEDTEADADIGTAACCMDRIKIESMIFILVDCCVVPSFAYIVCL